MVVRMQLIFGIENLMDASKLEQIRHQRDAAVSTCDLTFKYIVT